MNFEASIQELETIVKALENGTMPIEDSIEAFEKGVRIVKDCRKLLDDTQKQVATLIGEIQDEKENH